MEDIFALIPDCQLATMKGKNNYFRTMNQKIAEPKKREEKTRKLQPRIILFSFAA